MRPFEPLSASPHLLTIAANYWPRRLDTRRWPVARTLYRTAPDVQVLVERQAPAAPHAGELVLVHGLEGSSRAGYMRSLAQSALASGYAVHRMNLRSCGGTEALCRTMYHAGLTADLRGVLETLAAEGRGPLYAVGYSLGGNVALRLAAELGAAGEALLAGVCAVSTPIDLEASVRRLLQPENRLYHWRFLRRMKQRMRLRHRLMPDVFRLDGLDRIRTLYEFDDRVTGPAFGFRGAEEYYRTQSAIRHLGAIRAPTLLIQAQDDPLIPFSGFREIEAGAYPALRLIAPRHGGHLGFLARRAPRFWLDGVILEWLAGLGNKPEAGFVHP